MDRKAKSRCRLGMVRVNNWSHSYLNIMKLENYGPTGAVIYKWAKYPW